MKLWSQPGGKFLDPRGAKSLHHLLNFRFSSCNLRLRLHCNTLQLCLNFKRRQFPHALSLTAQLNFTGEIFLVKSSCLLRYSVIHCHQDKTNILKPSLTLQGKQAPCFTLSYMCHQIQNKCLLLRKSSVKIDSFLNRINNTLLFDCLTTGLLVKKQNTVWEDIFCQYWM